MFRNKAMLHKTQPEALDEPLQVSAPHQRVFTSMLVLLIVILALGGLATLVF